MLICGNCRIKLEIIKTGMKVIGNDGYVIQGDLWECPKCFHETVQTANAGRLDSSVTVDLYDIEVDW